MILPRGCPPTAAFLINCCCTTSCSRVQQIDPYFSCCSCSHMNNNPMQRHSLSSSSSEDDEHRFPEIAKSCNPNLKQTSPNIDNPAQMDVLLGRGRWNSTHPGNRRLQILINMNLSRYEVAQTRKAKTKITLELVYIVKNCGIEPGRFIQYVDERKTWIEIEDDVARLKVAQAFRYTIRSPPDCVITKCMLDDHEKVHLETHSSATTTTTTRKRPPPSSNSSSSIEHQQQPLFPMQQQDTTSSSAAATAALRQIVPSFRDTYHMNNDRIRSTLLTNLLFPQNRIIQPTNENRIIQNFDHHPNHNAAVSAQQQQMMIQQTLSGFPAVRQHNHNLSPSDLLRTAASEFKASTSRRNSPDTELISDRELLDYIRKKKPPNSGGDGQP